MRIHHLGYAVKSMDESIRAFSKIGYKKAGETVLDEKRSVLIQFMRLGDYCIELVAPGGSDSPINSIISKSGNTPYHICYSVDNIDKVAEEFKKEGYVMVEKPSNAVVYMLI
jgi:methylmalonyl-CoA/ethylmalonyl-CoA epimerase